jgi:hypothetical protein
LLLTATAIAATALVWCVIAPDRLLGRHLRWLHDELQLRLRRLVRGRWLPPER